MEPIMPHAATALPHGTEHPQSLASRMLAQRDKPHPQAHAKPGKSSLSHEALLNLEGMLTMPHRPAPQPPQHLALPRAQPRVVAKPAVQQRLQGQALSAEAAPLAAKPVQSPAGGDRAPNHGHATGKRMVAVPPASAPHETVAAVPPASAPHETVAAVPLASAPHETVAAVMSGTPAGQVMHDKTGVGGQSRNTASVAKEKPVDHEDGAQAAMQLAHHPDRFVPVTDTAPAMPSMPRVPRPVLAPVETLPPDGSLTYTFKHWKGNRFVTVRGVSQPDDAVRWHFAASDATTGRHLAGQVPPAFATQWQVGEESGQSGSGQSYQEGHSRQSSSRQGDEEEA